MAKTILVKRLKDKGYPTSSKHYKAAHEEASKAEKKKYPKGYAMLKKDEKHLDKHELMATNKKSGKIEIERKYKRYANELKYHESEEHKNLKRLEKRKK